MKFADPENNIKQFALKPGQVIADFGAGTGMYSIAAAKAVGSNGTVYAVEVQKDLVTKIEKEAKEAHVFNVQAKWGDIESLNGTKIRDNTVDAVLLSNILFQIENFEGLMTEIARISKPHARILIVDWSDSHGGLGPEASVVMNDEDVRAFLEKHGYVFEGYIDAGAHHFGFSMGKP